MTMVWFLIIWYFAGLASWPAAWARFRARHVDRYSTLEKHKPGSGEAYANEMATIAVFMGAASLPAALFVTRGTGWKWR